jgi:hypothetical protein
MDQQLGAQHRWVVIEDVFWSGTMMQTTVPLGRWPACRRPSGSAGRRCGGADRGDPPLLEMRRTPLATYDELEILRHDHVFLGYAHNENARRTLWVVILTTVMMVGEIVAGTIFNSMALLADGFHMATHAGALAVAAGAYAFAKRNATSRRFSFGTGKVGDLAGFASALILSVVALGIAIESIGRLLEPRQVALTEATVWRRSGLSSTLSVRCF